HRPVRRNRTLHEGGGRAAGSKGAPGGTEPPALLHPDRGQDHTLQHLLRRPPWTHRPWTARLPRQSPRKVERLAPQQGHVTLSRPGRHGAPGGAPPPVRRAQPDVALDGRTVVLPDRSRPAGGFPAPGAESDPRSGAGRPERAGPPAPGRPDRDAPRRRGG